MNVILAGVCSSWLTQPWLCQLPQSTHWTMAVEVGRVLLPQMQKSFCFTFLGRSSLHERLRLLDLVLWRLKRIADYVASCALLSDQELLCTVALTLCSDDPDELYESA